MSVTSLEWLHHDAGVSVCDLLDLDDARLQHGCLHGISLD
jgi:hypothetical protein